MTTTERYSKANSLSSQSLSTSEMGHYGLPAWKQQLLERKAVNERIWKQAESKKARAAMSSFNRDPERARYQGTDTSNEVLNGGTLDEQGSSASLPGYTNVSSISMNDSQKRSANKLPGSRHLELMSPQPYTNKTKLRNAMTIDAAVVEEAVVKVKENPFKMMESEKNSFSKSNQRSQRSPEPIYMNAHIDNQIPSRGRKTARVEPQISSHVQQKHPDENDANIGQEFSHVRSMWESRDTEISNRNLVPTSSKLSDSVSFSKPLGMSRTRSNYDSYLKESLSPEVPHRVDSINIVASQMPLTAQVDTDSEVVPDSTRSELPLPNTVSSLKNVYESKDSQSSNRSPFRFRLRDKTPPPAGFRKVHTNSVTSNENNVPKLTVYQSYPTTPVNREDRPTATVRPVVLSPKTEMEAPKLVTPLKKHTQNVSASPKLEIEPMQVASTGTVFKAKALTLPKQPVSSSNAKTETRGAGCVYSNSNIVKCIQYKDDICVENYVPKFVHEYTSDRVTSLLNSLIRDSICFRVMPRSVTAGDESALRVHPPVPTNSALVKTLHQPEVSDPNMKALEASTPTVVVIEKPEIENTSDRIYDASNKLFEQPEANHEQNENSSVIGSEQKVDPPRIVETEDPTHPKILVFQQSFLGYKNTEENMEKVFSKVDASPYAGGELLEVESNTLPVITSFKDESQTLSGDSVQQVEAATGGKMKVGGLREAIVVLSTPLPPDLKSCISQKLNVSAGRKISFHEDVYVHEYPVVSLWASEEEDELGGGHLKGCDENGIDVETAASVTGAPLAAIEDEMDMFSSPAGSLSDLSHTHSAFSVYGLEADEAQSEAKPTGKKQAPVAPLSSSSCPSEKAPPIVNEMKSTSLEDLVAIDDDQDSSSVDHKPPSDSRGSRVNKRQKRGSAISSADDYTERFHDHDMYSSNQTWPHTNITDDEEQLQQHNSESVVDQSQLTTTTSITAAAASSVIDTAMLF